MSEPEAKPEGDRARTVSRPLACVEVGGSTSQTVVFSSDTTVLMDGVHQPAGARLALAVPGLLAGHRVVSASNLGWVDVDPVEVLGLRGPADVVCTDAEAAAIGEAALRGGADGGILAFVGLGTGIGGAVVVDGRVLASNIFGHASGFGDLECRCDTRGCLETVAAGWALADELDAPALSAIAASVARAVVGEPAAAHAQLIVVAGGMTRRHPALVDLVGDALGDRRVEPTAAPAAAKSAAAWGLRTLAEPADSHPGATKGAQ